MIYKGDEIDTAFSTNCVREESIYVIDRKARRREITGKIMT
jgi:hypothetical protein